MQGAPQNWADARAECGVCSEQLSQLHFTKAGTDSTKGAVSLFRGWEVHQRAASAFQGLAGHQVCGGVSG